MTRTGNVVSLRCGFSDCMAPLLHMAYLRDIDVDGLVSRHLPASSESKQFGSRSRALAALLDFASTSSDRSSKVKTQQKLISAWQKHRIRQHRQCRKTSSRSLSQNQLPLERYVQHRRRCRRRKPRHLRQPQSNEHSTRPVESETCTA